jgi:general secretion pathway protein H
MRRFDRRANASACGRRAFTLLEIMLSLAVIALLAGVLITGSVHLMGDKSATPEDVFWKAVQEARSVALHDEQDVRVTFDDKEKVFVVDDGTTPKFFPVPASRDVTVDFLATSGDRSTVLVGGDLVESKTIPAVTFYRDGTCTPFRVQFRNGGGARFVEIDPWTCAKALPRDDNTS